MPSDFSASDVSVLRKTPVKSLDGCRQRLTILYYYLALFQIVVQESYGGGKVVRPFKVDWGRLTGRAKALHYIASHYILLILLIVIPCKRHPSI